MTPSAEPQHSVSVPMSDETQLTEVQTTIMRHFPSHWPAVEAGATNGTINRELGSLKRMFRIALQHTPPKVARALHIPMLEERNIRSGFFEHEDFLALRGVLPDYAQVTATLAYYSGMRMGEVTSLKWSQVNWSAGKLSLRAQDTKTETPRVLYLTGDLLRVLTVWKKRCDQKWPKCPWICHRGGIRLESLKHSWRKACERVELGKMVEVGGTKEKVWVGKIPHDFRRTAVRNMVRAGVPEKIAMAISGHKTRSVFERYNIVNEADLEQAAKSMTAYFEREKAKMVTLTVTPVNSQEESSGSASRKEVESSAEFMELARGIEPPTCGLQNRCSAIELRQPARNITHLRGRCQPTGRGVCPDCTRRVAASRPGCPTRSRSHTADR
jgi:integrase